MKKICKLAICLLAVNFIFANNIFAQENGNEKSPVAGKRYANSMGHEIEFSEDGNRFCFYGYREIHFGYYAFEEIYEGSPTYSFEYDKPKRSALNIHLEPPATTPYTPIGILVQDDALTVARVDNRLDTSYKYVGAPQTLVNKLANTTHKDGRFVFTKNTVTVNAYTNPVYNYEWQPDSLGYKISGYPPTSNVEKFLEYIDKKALKELKAESENEMTYEKAFWLYLMSEYKDDIFENKKAQETYFQTYHAKEYAEIKNDQFSLHERMAKIKSEMQQTFNEKAPPKDEIYSARLMGTFGEYDFDKKQFVINAKANHLHSECEIPNPYEGLEFYNTINAKLSHSKLFDGTYGFWESATIFINFPVEIEEARKFDKKPVLIVVYYKPSFQTKIGNRNNVYCEIVSYELYDSPETMVKLK